MKNSEYILYLDMDGVLVDYSSGWLAIAKSLKIRPMPKSNDFDKNDLIRVHQATINREFWAGLGWEHGGKELWKAANELFENVHILSSTAAKKDAKKGAIVQAGKLVWLKKHLPHLNPNNIHIVSEGIEKAKFATPLSILVDDRQSTVKAFAKAGGYGIVHKPKQYQSTIRDLEELAHPIRLGEIAERLPIVKRGFWNRK